MRDTISRQDALAAIATIVARINAINSNAGSVARDALAAINALPAVECKQCSELVHEINGDGIHDDTAAIQERLDALPKGGWPVGTYRISGAITLPKGAVIISDTSPPE